MAFSGAEKILIIDDDDSILFMLQNVLETEGYQILTAPNGFEALKVLQKEGIPKLILLDMRMPVMDGWKFAAEFNARHDHSAPIVVITAAANAKQRAEDIQATNWLGKPFKLEDILAIVSKYVHKSQPAA